MLWKLIKDSSETWRYSFAENIQDSYLHFRAKRHLPGDQSFVAQLWEHPVSDLKKMELYWYMWVDLLFYTYFASFITQYLTMLCLFCSPLIHLPPPQSGYHIYHHQDLLLRVLVPVQTEATGGLPEQSTQCSDSDCWRESLPPSDVWETERKSKHSLVLTGFKSPTGSACFWFQLCWGENKVNWPECW